MQQQRTDTQSAQASSSHSSMQQPEGDVSPQASGTRSSSADLVSSSVVERDSPTDRGAHLRGGSREEGEGQGPRKEFFALVGAAMTTPGTGCPHVLQICVCACPSPPAANQICKHYKARLDHVMKLDQKSCQCMLYDHCLCACPCVYAPSIIWQELIAVQSYIAVQPHVCSEDC